MAQRTKRAVNRPAGGPSLRCGPAGDCAIRRAGISAPHEAAEGDFAMCTHLTMKQAVAWCAALLWNEWRVSSGSWDQPQHIEALRAAWIAAAQAYEPGLTCRAYEERARECFEISKEQRCLPF